MSQHRVEVVYGVSEAYTVNQTKVMGKPEHITGRSLMVDLSNHDYSDIQAYGPFAWIDATLYAEHAANLPTFEEAAAFLRDIEAREVPGARPNNDWTGVFAPLAFI